MTDIVYSKGLSDLLRAQIRELDDICSAAEPLCMKLNWDILETRPVGEINDLFTYDDGLLVGYLGLYGFGAHPEEIELTGMVRPDYRRRGIFTRLFNEAAAICRSRGAKRLLLVAERQTPSGAGFAGNTGLVYTFSEYRLLCGAYKPTGVVPDGFSFRPAGAGDTSFINALDHVCFGRTYTGEYTGELERLFIASLDGRDIGKIGLNYEDGMGYIFGVALLPEFRGRGYGRAMLDTVLKKHFDSSVTPVILEVAVKNDGALSLYKSCGFAEITVYDYYEMRLEAD